jgi:hypothetical protein
MRGLALFAVVAAGLAAPAAADAGIVASKSVGPDTQRIKYSYGPIYITPGQNLNLIGPVTIERPLGEGFVTRAKPDLIRSDGSVPNVDIVHLHHGVFMNLSATDKAAPQFPERFGGSGEEKTIGTFPPGFGYHVKADDVWAINHMVHNQTAQPETVYITYEVDWVPADTPTGRSLKAARPLWLDVEGGKSMPVFDVHRRAGGRDGRWRYPEEAKNPYGGGPRRNVWTADQDGTLVATAGHLHPGGLWTDLYLKRGNRRKLIFRSRAKYWDPNGPVSWDLSMTHSKRRWRVGFRKGDKLVMSTVYETKRASWYESMGINLAFYVPGMKGPNPFKRRIPWRGKVTHGHLAENENYGGARTGLPDPRKLADGQTLERKVGIMDFQYLPGGFGLPDFFQAPPVVRQGEGLSFESADATLAGMLHTVTTCRAPCTGSTGISYPLANGRRDLDSGNLGYGPAGYTVAANRYQWETPKDLKPGTYTYFCRVHPFMRGAFRVAGKNPSRR